MGSQQPTTQTTTTLECANQQMSVPIGRPRIKDTTTDSMEATLVLLTLTPADNLTCMEVPEIESLKDDEKRGRRNLMMLQKKKHSNAII